MDFENLHGLAAAIQNGSLRFKAAASLKRNVQTAIRAVNPETRRFVFPWRWAGVLASAVLIVALGWAATYGTRTSEETLLVNDIVASHVRSTMANHIIDVASSDSHTVKPWFSGKLDYSPPTKDFTEQGFRLIGGRLDYLDNRPVAALVYQRSQHVINLLVWPATGPTFREPLQLTSQGYNLIHWTQSDMSYWLISELNLTELSECARLLKE
jgi:anti-sigma factor RsiW